MHSGLSIVSLQWPGGGAGERETPWPGTLFLINGPLLHRQSFGNEQPLFTLAAAPCVKLKRTSESLNNRSVCRSLISHTVLLGMGAHANNIPLSYKIKAGYEHHPSR